MASLGPRNLRPKNLPNRQISLRCFKPIHFLQCTTPPTSTSSSSVSSAAAGKTGGSGSLYGSLPYSMTGYGGATSEGSGLGGGQVVSDSVLPSLTRYHSGGPRCGSRSGSVDQELELKAAGHEHSDSRAGLNQTSLTNNPDSNSSPKRESILPKTSTPLHYQ